MIKQRRPCNELSGSILLDETGSTSFTELRNYCSRCAGLLMLRNRHDEKGHKRQRGRERMIDVLCNSRALVLTGHRIKSKDRRIYNCSYSKMTSQEPQLPALFSLKGLTALVIGGTRGIGREMCLALAEAGANIILIQVSLIYIDTIYLDWSVDILAKRWALGDSEALLRRLRCDCRRSTKTISGMLFLGCVLLVLWGCQLSLR